MDMRNNVKDISEFRFRCAHRSESMSIDVELVLYKNNDEIHRETNTRRTSACLCHWYCIRCYNVYLL